MEQLVLAVLGGEGNQVKGWLHFYYPSHSVLSLVMFSMDLPGDLKPCMKEDLVEEGRSLAKAKSRSDSKPPSTTLAGHQRDSREPAPLTRAALQSQALTATLEDLSSQGET